MWLRRFGAVSVAAAILIPAAAAATVDAGGIGVRLLAPPGSAAGSPLARSYVVGVVAPGGSIRRRVEFDNSTPQPARVAVYAGAASIRRSLFVFASGRTLNDLARWTGISSRVLYLRPGGHAVVTLTVRVPPDASGGERYAVVWAEPAATVSNRVRLVNRVGIRLYLGVGPGGRSPAAFTIGRLSAARSSAGDPLVRATVRNSGSRTLLLAGDLALSRGPGGSKAGPFPAALDVALAPGASAEVRVVLDRRLPLGPWSARLHLSSGPLEHVVVATVRFPPGRLAARAGSAPGDDRRLSLARFVLFDILLIAVAAAAVFARRRMIRRPA